MKDLFECFQTVAGKTESELSAEIMRFKLVLTPSFKLVTLPSKERYEVEGQLTLAVSYIQEAALTWTCYDHPMYGGRELVDRRVCTLRTEGKIRVGHFKNTVVNKCSLQSPGAYLAPPQGI